MYENHPGKAWVVELLFTAEGAFFGFHTLSAAEVFFLISVEK
jgi:hypothetical protein